MDIRCVATDLLLQLSLLDGKKRSSERKTKIKQHEKKIEATRSKKILKKPSTCFKEGLTLQTGHSAFHHAN